MRALANPQDGAGKRNGVLEQRSIGVSNPSVHHSSTPTEEANKRNEAYDFFAAASRFKYGTPGSRISCR